MNPCAARWPQAWRPALALLTALAFLAACTQQVQRPPVAERHYVVDWSALDAPLLALDGLTVQGVVFTPRQWPLEASLKRLLQGDFTGVLDRLDWRFHSATIPQGVLEDLYQRGFVPAYVRVRNAGAAPAAFAPERLAVQAGPAELPQAAPEELPATFRELDVERTAQIVLAVALLVVVVAAGRDNRDVHLDVGVRLPPPRLVAGDSLGAGAGLADSGAASFEPADRGLLRALVVEPGQSLEGVVLFRLSGGLPDWSQARLVVQ